MMFSPYGYAIACKREGDILVYHESFANNQPSFQMGLLSRIPFLRGIVAFLSSLGISLRAYLISHKLSKGEDSSFRDFDQWLFLQLLLNSFLAVLLLVILPDIFAHLIASNFLFISFWETLLRIFLLIVFLYVFSLFPSGKRLLQYHGAEHKTINAFEAGAELVPEEVEIYPTLHTRCGTTLFALVLLILFILYLPFQNTDFITRILTKIVVFPFSLPIAFELIYLAWQDKRFSFLITPGLLLQKITTREPGKEQIEVAIIALQEVVRNA